MARNKKRKDDGYEQLDLFEGLDFFQDNFIDDGRKESENAQLVENTSQINASVHYGTESRMSGFEGELPEKSSERKTLRSRWVSRYEELLGRFRLGSRTDDAREIEGKSLHDKNSKTNGEFLTNSENIDGLTKIRFDIYQNDSLFIDDIQFVGLNEQVGVFKKNGLEMTLPITENMTFKVNSLFYESIQNDVYSHISQNYGQNDEEQNRLLNYLEYNHFEDFTNEIINTQSDAKHIYIGNIPVIQYSIKEEEIEIKFNDFTLDSELHLLESQYENSQSLDKVEMAYHYAVHLMLVNEDRKIQENVIPTEITQYRLRDEDEQSLSANQKFEKNLKAIQTLKVIENNENVTEQQQHILAQYSGWGGLPQVFDDSNDKWTRQRNQLKNLVSQHEYDSFKESTLSAFYTPYLVIDKIYKGLHRMGFESGSILEPSCGTGNFIGRMPEDMLNKSHVSAVEIDDISSSIASYLYPDITVENCGYEETNFENETFDLAITNVPFGQYSVYDRDYSKSKYMIHDYFFMKSLDKVRAGGFIAFITSQSTLDKKDDKVRLEIAQKAEFLGAIRLPNNLFKLNGANTEVSSDIIFLKKRDEMVRESDLYNLNEDMIWLNTGYFDTNENNEDAYCNNYFQNHPEMVIGELKIDTNQFGHPVVKTVLNHFKELDNQLETAIKQLPSDIYVSALVSSIDNELSEENTFTIPANMQIKNGAYFIYQEKLAKRYDSIGQYIDENIKNYDRLYQMMIIKESIDMVFRAQDSLHTDEDFERALKLLNQNYDQFVKKYGYITSSYNQRLLKDDPNRFMLSVLENVDRTSKTATKSDIFYQRTIKIVEKVEPQNVTEAMYQSFNERGTLDVFYMSEILNRDYNDVYNELLDHKFAFIDPETNNIIDANSYLSGNVRKKLEIAKEFNEKENDKYQNNVESLEIVMPKDIDISDIKCQMGAVFIPGEYVKEFIIELFQLKDKHWIVENMSVDLNTYSGQWDLNIGYLGYSAIINETWGVPNSDGIPWYYSQPDVTGIDLVNWILTSQIPVIRDYYNQDGTRKSRVNPERTNIARMKMDEIKQLFEDWVVKDLERRQVIQKNYNEMFNSYVNRNYNGDFLTFPGMSQDIQLENYQKNAISRMIFGGNTLLAQVVGAGKTFEMIAASQEMKRVGLCHKPMFVVPNHLVEQWANDFQRLYPQTNILAITTNDFKKNARKAFINKIAVNNYDAVIVAHSSFGMIPMSKEYQIDMLEQEKYNLDLAISDMENQTGKQTSVKNMEKAKKSLESQIKKLQDKKYDEDVPLFENLGVDQLFIDEAHEFKNLYYTTKQSNIAGIQNTGSQKAWDLFTKTQYMREKGQHIVMATGTPISNSIGELYTFQRYLQYDALVEKNIESFDLWAKTFGEVINSFEISVDGTGFKNRLRFNKFYNVPELMTMFRCVAEIQTKGMLKREMENSQIGRQSAKAPGFIGGKPQVVVVEPSEELENYIADIVKRTEAIHRGGVDPRYDNMLKITTDSKKASIDMRLIDEGYGEQSSGKLRAVSDKVYEVYKDYDEDKATQLIFCDSSAPKEGFNVYDELKKNLIEMGVPSEEIAFIHDAHTDIQKEALFDKVRKGTVRVLIGSTQKMGAGTNVQDRVIAVHHVDVPWRSSDVEQQNGRGFRQGNRYENIYEFRYATKKSFDSYSWQIIENKSTYMQQLLEGTSDKRSIEDDCAMTLSYGEIKAIASGNPMIKEKMELESELKQLETQKKFYNKQIFNAERGIVQIPGEIEQYRQQYQKMIPFIESIQSIPEKFDENWSIELNGKTFDNYKEAGDMLTDLSKHLTSNEKQIVGHYGDYSVGIHRIRTHTTVLFVGYQNMMWDCDDLHAVGRVNFDRIDRQIRKIANKNKNLPQVIDDLNHDLQENKNIVKQPFKSEERLSEVRKRLNEINTQLDLEQRKEEYFSDEEVDQNNSLDSKIQNAEVQCDYSNSQSNVYQHRDDMR